MTPHDQPGMPEFEDLWAGLDFMEPPPDDDSGVTDEERRDADPNDFWKQRPVLTTIHDFARARMAGPWAVLGAVLTRIVCATPFYVKLPPTIGSVASLNLFVGLVGKSGDGKDIAQSVARDAVYITNADDFTTIPIGSGEGLAHAFMRPPRQGEMEPQWVRHSALVTIAEIDTLGALNGRKSSTTAPQLRQAAMGQTLGFQYAAADKRIIVPEHMYRLSLIAGIQPEKSATLLDDSAGGTPQRFVWLPAGDPYAPDILPEPPNPIIWEPPDWDRCEKLHLGNQLHHLIHEPEEAVAAIIGARRARLREDGEALDGHALLTRAKVAAALALLDGRLAITPDDWHLSGVIMAVSDSQRARCKHALDEAARRANEGKALAEADRAVIIQDRTDEEKVKRTVSALKRALAGQEPMARRQLQSKLGRNAGYLDAAVERLQATGELRLHESVYRNRQVVKYELNA